MSFDQVTCSRLLCSAASCGIPAQVLLALLLFVIVGSCHCPGAPTQPSGERHFTQHHDGGEDGGGGGTSVSVNNIRTQGP